MGDVAVEESALHGEFECCVDDHVDFVNGLVSEAGGVLAAGGCQGLVEGVEESARSRRNGTCPIAGLT